MYNSMTSFNSILIPILCVLTLFYISGVDLRGWNFCLKVLHRPTEHLRQLNRLRLMTYNLWSYGQGSQTSTGTWTFTARGFICKSKDFLLSAFSFHLILSSWSLRCFWKLSASIKLLLGNTLQSKRHRLITWLKSSEPIDHNGKKLL